jgi:hypothetical protein
MAADEPQQNFFQELWARRPGLIIAVLLIIVLLLCLSCAALSVAVWQTVTGTDDRAVTEPTPFPEGIGITAAEPLVVGISEAETISVTLDLPATLRLGGQTFAVQSQALAADGLWSPQLSDAETAVWVYGTIINYIVGLPASSENRTLLTQLAPGDEVRLTTRGGVDFAFTVDERRTVPVTERQIFAQNRPGITLLLMGDRADGADQRLVVKGSYVVSESPALGASDLVELGETAQLDDLQFTVTGATYLPDRPEVPSGFAFYLVDFEVQNVGLTAVDISQYQFVLRDEIGNQFAPSPVASQLGNYPPLSGFINANQSRQASAGYQIPRGLLSPSLNWIIGRSGSPGQIQVSIPFSGSPQAASGAAVSLQQVEVSEDRTALIITGEVANMGEQPLVISEENITLRSPDGASHLLLSTNPPFPWSIPSGQAIQFRVTYQRPPGDSAIFTVLNQPFQLTGLR